MATVNYDDRIWEGGRWRYAVSCDRCQKTRYLPWYHAEVTSFCKRCSNAEKARDYRLKNPSPSERRLIKQLTEMKIDFEREVRCGPWNIDFVIGQYAIEVNGGKIHTRFRDPDREERRKADIEAHYTLLIMSDSDTKNCKRRLKGFLDGTGASS